jgi:hypothetical protein
MQLATFPKLGPPQKKAVMGPPQRPAMMGPPTGPDTQSAVYDVKSRKQADIENLKSLGLAQGPVKSGIVLRLWKKDEPPVLVTAEYVDLDKEGHARVHYTTSEGKANWHYADMFIPSAGSPATAYEGERTPVRTFVEPAKRPPLPSLEEVAATIPKRKLPPQVWSWEELGQREMVAKESTEVDTLQNKMHKISNELEAALPTVQDEGERVKLRDKAKQQILALQGSSQNVERQHQNNLSKLMPQLENRFNEIHHRKIIERTGEEGKYNFQAALEEGKAELALTIAEKMKATGTWTPERYAYEIAGVEAKAVILPAYRKINSGDPAQIAEAMKSLESADKKGWPLKQVEDAREALNRGQIELNQEGVVAENEIDEAETALHGKRLGAVEFGREAEAIREKILSDPRLVGVKRATKLREHEAWVARYAEAGNRAVEQRVVETDDSIARRKLEIDRLPAEQQDAARKQFEQDAMKETEDLGLPAKDRFRWRGEIRRWASGEENAEARRVKEKIGSILLAAYQSPPTPEVLKAIMAEAHLLIDENPALTDKEKIEQHKRVSAMPAGVGAGRDAPRIEDLRRRLEVFEQTGNGGEALKKDIQSAIRENACGIGKAGESEGARLLSRVNLGKFSPTRRAIGETRSKFRIYVMANDPDGAEEKLHLFDTAFDLWLEAHPDATPGQAFAYAQFLSASYRDMTPERKRQIYAAREPVPEPTKASPPAAGGAREVSKTYIFPLPAPPEAIPPADKREVGKIYTNAAGTRAKWNGAGAEKPWEKVQ